MFTNITIEWRRTTVTDSRRQERMEALLRAIILSSLIVSVRTSGQTGAQAEAERVIVTGSNIPTSEEVGPNPVLNINRDLINKSGQGTTVEELLKTQPVMNANGVPVNNNGTGAGAASSVSLRGFDPSATLVLI